MGMSRSDNSSEVSSADAASCSSSPTTLGDDTYNPNRCYCVEQLDVLNVLIHPVWVFDIDSCRIPWANEAAVALWNAESLESLRARLFGNDMSESTKLRLQDYSTKFKRGERVQEQWTLYPNGQAKTVKCSCSGVYLEDNQSSLCMLVEGVYNTNDETIESNSLRGVEIIRHLPMAVSQFNLKGEIMFENPKATQLFGGLSVSPTTEASSPASSSEQKQKPQQKNSSIEPESRASISSTLTTASNPFLLRFVDKKLGERIFSQVMQCEQNTVSVEAEQQTAAGPITWNAIQLRRSKDPVTGEAVILYSAQDITDVLMARKQQELNVRKSEFFAIIAHEIRTPLYQVTGFIELLDQTHLSAEQKSFVRLLKTSSGSLMSVINDMLDFSKLEAGRMKLEYIPLEPKAVLQGSMEAVRPTFEEKGLSLKLNCRHQLPFKILGDPNRMRQILLNLLQNAVKFTSRGGVEIKVERVLTPKRNVSNGDTTSSSQLSPENSKHGTPHHRPFLKMSVIDTGIGLKQEDIDRIFVKYQQAQASVARTHGGTGLGLSICKILTENMGGSIGVESAGLGRGSTFWFTIPCEVPAENCSENSEHDEEEIRQVDIPKRPRHERHSRSSPDIAMPRELQVLVVEDTIINQKLLSKMLKTMGHVPTLAVNGKVAVEMIESSPPGRFDVILMDIQMPVMDGIEATKRIRSSELSYVETLPIIALTASIMPADFEELGFTDWLSKPVPMKELQRKLAQQQQQSMDRPSQRLSQTSPQEAEKAKQ